MFPYVRLMHEDGDMPIDVDVARDAQQDERGFSHVPQNGMGSALSRARRCVTPHDMPQTPCPASDMGLSHNVRSPRTICNSPRALSLP